LNESCRDQGHQIIYQAWKSLEANTKQLSLVLLFIISREDSNYINKIVHYDEVSSPTQYKREEKSIEKE